MDDARISFDFSNFTGTSLNKGERVNLVYSASDVDSDLGQVRFEFRNENGNTITLYDNDDDGIASVRMEDWYNEGSYELHRISVEDTASSHNRIEYEADGTTDYWDQQNSITVYGTHNFDFSEIKFSYKKLEEVSPTDQTDFTPPELISFDFSDRNFVEKPIPDDPVIDDSNPDDGGNTIEVPVFPEFYGKAGEKIFVRYSANDLESNIKNVNIRFRNEDGSSINGYDYDGDGFLEINLGSNLSNGLYSFERIQISDDANQSNSISYKVDGKTEYWDTVNSRTIHGTHDLNLETFGITVIEGSASKQILHLQSLLP